MNRFRALLVGFSLMPLGAMAHARLLTPPPRSTADDIKDPDGPCGNLPRGSFPLVYDAGGTVTVDWEETVNHPGCFLIALSLANDTGFQVLANVDHVGTGALPRPYSKQFALPAGVTCDNCTLQLRQIMLQNETQTCPPTNIPGGVTYYSCADIRIQGEVPVTDGGADAGEEDAGTEDAGSTDSGQPEVDGGGPVVGADGGSSDGGGPRDLEPVAGCGCQSGGMSALWSLGVIGLLLQQLRRRNREVAN